MNMRKSIATITLAGSALLTLAGCNREIDGEAVPVAAETLAAEPEPEPELEPAPAVPELDIEQIGEDAFVDTVAERGILYTSRGELIAAGRAVCDALDAGGSVVDSANIVATYGYSYSDAAYIAGAAMGSLCLTDNGALDAPLDGGIGI